jgi:methyl-accepting chemotaxis protein
MPVRKDRDAERAARFDMILEELRLNTEDMQELANQARERAIKTRDVVRSTIATARKRRAQARKARKKR